MLKFFIKNIKWDKDLPYRSKLIDVYTRIYRGTIYDHLPFFYMQERENGTDGAYIPLHRRQPSVKIPFCKKIVDDSVSLLFGGDHYPKFNCGKDQKLKKQIEDISSEYMFNKIMAKAATIGSTGSVVLLVYVIDNVLKVLPKNTKYFTPIFCKKSPDKLIKLIERYKVSGEILADCGYKIKDKKEFYWFHREWNNKSETYYLPYLCKEEKPKLVIDKDNSCDHNLGIVPAIWIRNLNDIIDSDEHGDVVDGLSTFGQVADANIEIDYQLSQAGRALKYSADPLLVLKLEDEQMTLGQNSVVTADDAGGWELHAGFSGTSGTPKLARSASNALILNEKDEAKLLEISGDACKAVCDYVRMLREYLMETASGNRSHADKVSSAQSGTAQKQMNQALIWLADQLRVSYGEAGLLKLINMIIHISNVSGYGIIVDGKIIKNINSKEKIILDWPPWYPDTPSDKAQNSIALKNLTDINAMSKETATKTISDNYNIDDVEEEIKKIEKDIKESLALQPKLTEFKTV